MSAHLIGSRWTARDAEASDPYRVVTVVGVVDATTPDPAVTECQLVLAPVVFASAIQVRVEDFEREFIPAVDDDVPGADEIVERLAAIEAREVQEVGP